MKCKVSFLMEKRATKNSEIQSVTGLLTKKAPWVPLKNRFKMLYIGNPDPESPSIFGVSGVGIIVGAGAGAGVGETTAAVAFLGAVFFGAGFFLATFFTLFLTAFFDTFFTVLFAAFLATLFTVFFLEAFFADFFVFLAAFLAFFAIAQ